MVAVAAYERKAAGEAYGTMGHWHAWSMCGGTACLILHYPRRAPAVARPAGPACPPIVQVQADLPQRDRPKADGRKEWVV
jgi:hypothetical protein